MELLRIMYAGMGLVLAVLSVPMIARKIKPNPWYGFRVKQTLENPEVWYKVNAYTGKYLLGVGIGITAASLGLSLIPEISIDAYSLICLAIFSVLFGAAIIKSWRYMKSIL